VRADKKLSAFVELERQGLTVTFYLKSIRVRFENDRVRVLEAILPPSTREQVHSHPAYVMYVLAGGRYRNYAADGKITEGAFETGDVVYRDALTHAAENIGYKPMHFILVELKNEVGR